MRPHPPLSPLSPLSPLLIMADAARANRHYFRNGGGGGALLAVNPARHYSMNRIIRHASALATPPRVGVRKLSTARQGHRAGRPAPKKHDWFRETFHFTDFDELRFTMTKDRAQTWVELATALGVNRRTVANWRKIPGAPKTQDVNAWRQFVDSEHLGTEAGHEVRAMRAEKLAVEVRLLRLKEQQALGELAPIADTLAYLSDLGRKFDQILTQKIDVEAPARLVGKEITSMRAECRIIHDEIRGIVNAGISAYKPPAST